MAEAKSKIRNKGDNRRRRFFPKDEHTISEIICLDRWTSGNVGAIALALGLGTQLLGAAFAFDMFVAISKAKIGMMKAPFSGQNGWDFEFSLMITGLALLFTGAGEVSLDALIGF